MTRIAISLRTVARVTKQFISVDEKWLWTFVTEMLGFVNNCYVRDALDDACIDVFGVPTEGHFASEVREYGSLLLSSNVRQRCAEDYCCGFFVQVQM